MALSVGGGAKLAELSAVISTCSQSTSVAEPLVLRERWPVADGPDGLRAKVREYVRAGADVIKVGRPPYAAISPRFR